MPHVTAPISDIEHRWVKMQNPYGAVVRFVSSVETRFIPGRGPEQLDAEPCAFETKFVDSPLGESHTECFTIDNNCGDGCAICRSNENAAGDGDIRFVLATPVEVHSWLTTRGSSRPSVGGRLGDAGLFALFTFGLWVMAWSAAKFTGLMPDTLDITWVGAVVCVAAGLFGYFLFEISGRIARKKISRTYLDHYERHSSEYENLAADSLPAA